MAYQDGVKNNRNMVASQYLYPSNIYRLKYNVIMILLKANALVRWLGHENSSILFCGGKNGLR